MKYFTILLLSALLSFYLFSSTIRHPAVIIKTFPPVVITINLVGDLMCHTPEMDFGRTGKDSFDFKPPFSAVKNILSKGDLTIGNLETTVSGKERRYSGYPYFNSPPEFLDALKDAGFNVLTTTNNHALDRGIKGVLNTFDEVSRHGMIPIGTFKSESDRDSIRIFNLKGIKVAIIAYSYGLNGNYISKKDKYAVNLIDTALIKSDIQNARKQNAEIVLAYFHFGQEYERQPDKYQTETVGAAIRFGADLIIGSHPHVIQPLQSFSTINKKFKSGLIAYSLGNFISNQRWRYSDAGVILRLQITKEMTGGNLILSSVSVLPTWVYKGFRKGKNGFIILPDSSAVTDSLMKSINSDEVRKLSQAFSDTRLLLKPVTSFPFRSLNLRARGVVNPK